MNVAQLDSADSERSKEKGRAGAVINAASRPWRQSDLQRNKTVAISIDCFISHDTILITRQWQQQHRDNRGVFLLRGAIRHSGKMGRKSNRAKEKKARRQEERAAMDAVCAKVDAANKLDDPLTAFPAFKKYDRNGLNLQIECKRVTTLNPLSVEWAFELTRANMQTLYEQSEWGWKEREKREEMNDERAWYLLARDGDSAPVAFSHFRFDVECGEEVLYCYEVQLESRVRRKGLGKFLIQILQLIANSTQMKKVMLTVFKHNHGAYQFFRDALQFEIDETSPSMSGCCGDDCSYEILSRRTKHGEASAGHTHGGGHCGGCCH
ncbi:N-alpha-acetyltransferase 40 [Solea senegalensis]|uniref:N-alpha-acetyltransferase 40 n=1 Tax=Solea senegalensis TaxID=28829 RepID=A0AAV6QYH8_SOLSE|nr:N-alpha-acetyltransferase 40 [Solea senegalensis]